MQNVDDLCQNESGNLKQGFSNGKSTMGSQNILNDVSMDVSDLPDDVPQMISSV
jgi:hypothetical protein